MRGQWRRGRRRGRKRSKVDIWGYLCIILIIFTIIYGISYGIYYLTVITYGLIWIPVIVIIILIFYKKVKSYNLKKKAEYSVYYPPPITRDKVEHKQNKSKQLKESNIREMQAAQRKFRIFRSARYIPKNIRNIVWERDKGRCAECGSSVGLEFEYIIPLSKGGSNIAENIQILCEKCIRKKFNEIGFREVICPSCKRINIEKDSEKINICSYCGADLKRNYITKKKP